MIVTDIDVLRQPCSNATADEVGHIVELLEQELERSERIGRPGIGLAAPQIGIHKNVAIVRISKHYRVDLINCKITKAYDEALFTDEGCLSFPGRVDNTMRFQEIMVSDNLVMPHSFVATGLFAVVIQHELDHLNAILLPDRAIPKQPIIKKQNPNDICQCGSGKKFKKCHGR